jgi:hypothetical protein
MLRFATTFADQNGATTFTGLLPPVLASVSDGSCTQHALCALAAANACFGQVLA